MRYMLVNVSEGNLQIDLHHPTKPYVRKKLHRLGPEVAIILKRGDSIDVLPFFNNSLEFTHSVIKNSLDVMRTVGPGRLVTYVCDDEGNQIDVEKLLGDEAAKKPVEVKVPESYLVPPTREIEIIKPKKEIEQIIAAKIEAGKIEAPKTFKRYSRDELTRMSKQAVLKVADKMGLIIDKHHDTKEEVIAVILGA